MMHNKLVLYILSLIILSTSISSCSIHARIKKADRKYAIGEYYEAGEMYRQAYRRIPTKERALRAHVAFQQGESFRVLNN